MGRNGAMIRLAPGEPEIIDHVPVGRLYKDGEIVIDEADKAIPERRKLSIAGIATIAIAIDSKGEIAGDPVIDVMGMPRYTRQGEELIDFVADTVVRTLDGLPRARRRDTEFVENAVFSRRALDAQQYLGQKACMPCARHRGMTAPYECRWRQPDEGWCLSVVKAGETQ